MAALEIKRQAIRSKSSRHIIRVVELVAKARDVEWQSIFSQSRGSKSVADARVFSIALCCAHGVPQYMVARAFQRNWATVFSAERRCSQLYQEVPDFRKEWDSLFKSSLPS